MRRTPELNELILQAAHCQDEFDRFDSDATEESQHRLREICEDWTAANKELVEYILTYGQDLLGELSHDEEGLDDG